MYKNKQNIKNNVIEKFIIMSYISRIRQKKITWIDKFPPLSLKIKNKSEFSRVFID
jgi:hypothetical protein